MYEGKECLMTGTRRSWVCGFGVCQWCSSWWRSRSPRAGPWRGMLPSMERVTDGPSGVAGSSRSRQRGVLTWSLRRDGAEEGQLLSWGHVVSGPFGRVIRPRENLLPPRRLWLWSESLTSRLLFSHWATCVTLRPSGLQHAGSSVLHYLLEFAQIPVHWIGSAV